MVSNSARRRARRRAIVLSCRRGKRPGGRHDDLFDMFDFGRKADNSGDKRG